MFLAFLGALGSVVAGELLAQSGEYDYQMLEEHEKHGVWFTIFFAVLLVINHVASLPKFEKISKALIPTLHLEALVVRINRLSMIMGLILLSVVGHLGGNLTHGASYLTEYWPFRAKKAVKVFASLEEPKTFEDVLLPIFEKKCIQCHNEGKIKGGLRMDTYEALMKGGESGATVVLGNPEESELYKLLIVDRKDERAMPPERKTPLSTEEIAIVKWWIQNNAPNETIVSEVPMDAPMKELLTGYVLGNKQSDFVSSLALPVPEHSMLSKIHASSWEINPLYAYATVYHAYYQEPSRLSDSTLATLLPLSEHIVSLDLSKSMVSDQCGNMLAQFTNLNKLYLQETSVGSTLLKSLIALPHLKYLNVYGTAVDDSIITIIPELKSLKKIYLWKSGVSAGVIDKIKEIRPDVHLVWAPEM